MHVSLEEQRPGRRHLLPVIERAPLLAVHPCLEAQGRHPHPECEGGAPGKRAVLRILLRAHLLVQPAVTDNVAGVQLRVQVVEDVVVLGRPALPVDVEAGGVMEVS